MVMISEVTIISIDKSEDSWAIEGEIVFESDLSTAFSTTYYPDDDEFEDFEIEIDPGNYDKKLLRQMIVRGALDYDE